MDRIVIVGAGTAGAHTAVALRQAGWSGPLALLGEEPHPPYDRPPLSKEVLAGKADSTEYEFDYRALDIDLLTGRRVESLDPERNLLHTADAAGAPAAPVPFDRLVLATGAAPVPLPGAAGPRVRMLRTVDDARALRGSLVSNSRLVVVGAGWIGAEAAGAARALGCEVTVLEAAPEPLAGALPVEVTDPMRAWYAEAGAELRTGVRVDGVDPDGTVRLADGARVPADTVLVGIGVRPATGWLAGSGVALDASGAVAADAALRTSRPGVWAVGDCASFPSGRYGVRLLVNHWDNAMQGAVAVAASVLAGGGPGGADGGSAGADSGSAGAPYDPVPYFWSEQFGRYVQYAGRHQGADTTVRRGDPATDPAWSVLWLRQGRLLAVLTVDRPRDLAQGRKLLARSAELDPMRAADPAVQLRAAAR